MLSAIYSSIAFLGRLYALVAGVGFLGLVSICIYRLHFHPYAKYPGPFLAKLTSWYSVYHTYIGDLHVDIWRCHEKYGDVVRYGPNRLLINTEAGLKGIYGHGKNVRKAKSYHRISLVKGVEATQSVVDKTKHGKLRRILNQGLSDSYIRTIDSELTELASLFALSLGANKDRFVSTSESTNDGWTCAKNMAHWCDYFTFDVMSQLVFGKSYHLLQSSENHWIAEAILGQMRRVSFLMQLPELEDMRLHKLLFPQARKKAMRFSLKSKEIMEKRKQALGETKNDLFSKLLEAKDPETGESLSQLQLWAESNLLIIAGSDTSSTAMAALFFYLSRYPEAYEKVVEEVRKAFRSAKEVSQGPKLSSCSYLRACITEAARLSPPAAGAMWREVQEGGLQVGNLYIPEGYDVGTGIYSINHNPEYYPEPFKFWPERWISEVVGDEAMSKAKSAYGTFSVGPRNCVGKGLAMIEISLAMAAVISEFDFRRDETGMGRVGEGKGVAENEYQIFWAFTSMKNGPYIQFRRVEATGLH
ncbi:benzoate 4-monooxygenase cytochrome p450 [Colletotrichum truncatum]|uniref:Benzoate 4-monooxygenase cytochrome p450 n=1 Tax=Colletotrichum truncatum TaxID=5467 RepID=A0ACC3YVC0_COLTU|nr:benzoate 4-monooxygenase cytochrome p450 [Colletotrichum truncatum]KAF6781591.1 benzoate 4-monooxygenase cytochrome p450 [Colletotrichum truncatum]